MNKLLKPNKSLFSIIIFVCLLAAYANSFKNQFVYDDVEFVVRNSYIKDLGNWSLFFSDISSQSEFIRFSHYRPLVTLSFAFDYAIGGLNPVVFHVTNFLLHGLNSILIFWLIGLLFKDDLLALATALLWGLHPVQTEAVSWVAGRGGIMATSFYLLSAISYIKWRLQSKRRWLACSGLAFLAGLFCKEMVVVLPLLLILIDYLEDSGGKHLRKKWWFYLVLLIIAGVFWLIRAHVVGGLAMPLTWSDDFFEILSTMSRVMGRYFFLLFVPLGLRADYQFPVTSALLRADVILILTLIIGLLYSIFYFREKKPLVSLSLGFFFINILPVSNLIPFQVIIAERFLYLPLLGFSLLCAHLIVGLKKWSKSLVYGVLLLICLVYIGLTWRQNKVWRNEGTLWTRVIKLEPENTKARYGLGTFYLNRGQYDRAAAELEVAVRLDDTSYLAFNNLGALYKMRQDYQRAIPYFKRAIELKRDLTEAYFNLSDSYAALRDYRNTAAVLERLKEILPESPDLYYRLVLAYQELGQIQQARLNYQKLNRLYPDYPGSDFLKMLLK